MTAPADRKYSESHEWHKLDGDILTLGVTKFAVDELTDITYAEMRPVGTKVEAGDPIGEVESVKATSEIYTAVAGEIVEVNDKVQSDPALLNTDPYSDGWLVRLKVADPSTLDALMDHDAYDKRFP